MKKLLLAILIIIPIVLGSCSSQKKIAYFRNVNETSADSINKHFTSVHESRICANDMLSIVVSALDPIAAEPFNLPVVAYETPGSQSVSQSKTLQYYIVDVNGDINFPIIGSIKLVGLTKSQAIALIEKELEPYLQDPIVSIKFLSYKISVEGEVSRPGQYTIDNERVTILDALAMAGDMTIYGKRKNVLIIRENFGKLEFARLNLNSDEVFTSPYYYLQQNDVVYVEPNNVKAISGLNITLYLSAITTLASVITVAINSGAFGSK